MTEEPEDLSKYFDYKPNLKPSEAQKNLVFAAFKRAGKKPEDFGPDEAEEYRQYLEQHIDDE
ncbi:MAG TPA: hypothetical protein PKE41_11830 [Candidatus Macondimonas sp.]|nr:hypothetical protein [Candidatus Macondimonas sp.]